MAEPQNIANDTSALPQGTPASKVHLTSESTIDVNGRSWVVLELEDHESWDLYAGTSPDPGFRLARVRITEGGYFSTDRAGTVRGPYVTLSEATYPLGLDDPLLLGDVVDQAPVTEPSPSGPAPLALQGPVDHAWLRQVLLLSTVVGLALLVQWVVSVRRKPRPTST